MEGGHLLRPRHDPGAVYPATEEKSLKFNQLHDEDMGRIRYKRVCEIDGEEVDLRAHREGLRVREGPLRRPHRRGLRRGPGRVQPGDRHPAVRRRSTRSTPSCYKKSYYLVPDETGAKAYALLRKALGGDGKVGIAKVSFRDKEHLAALRFKDDVFVLETMFWPDEIRAADFDDRRTPTRRCASRRSRWRSPLIENLTEPTGTPRSSRTSTARRCCEIVEKKIAGEEIEVVAERPRPRSSTSWRR